MKFIIGNWKMNGTKADKKDMIKALKTIKSGNKIVLCLPFTLLCGEQGGISIGAQDVSSHENGAYTGDISATMLKEMGVEYVIVGHSERRTNHDETNEICVKALKMELFQLYVLAKRWKKKMLVIQHQLSKKCYWKVSLITANILLHTNRVGRLALGKPQQQMK